MPHSDIRVSIEIRGGDTQVTPPLEERSPQGEGRPDLQQPADTSPGDRAGARDGGPAPAPPGAQGTSPVGAAPEGAPQPFTAESDRVEAARSAGAAPDTTLAPPPLGQERGGGQ